MANQSSSDAGNVTRHDGPNSVVHGSAASASNVSGIVINATMTAQPSTSQDEGEAGVPGGVIALLLCLLLVGVAVLSIVFYLKRTGKLYKMIPFKPLINPRRSSFSSSDRALHVDLPEDAAVAETDPGRATEEGGLAGSGSRREAAGMFTIEDQDLDSVDMDATSRGTNDDNEYFYDEVFAKSVFEDETTNNSMRHLYLASDDAEEEMLDVDDIVDRITGQQNAQPTKT